MVNKKDENSPLPERYRDPKYTIFENLMPTDWLADVGQWLHSQRGQFLRGGDDGRGRYNWELLNVDELYDQISYLKQAITDKIDDAVKQVGIEDFDLEYIECHATLYHHGSHFVWHTDREGYNGQPATTRRLSYCLYMHSEPRMFSGGELEFINGTQIDSKHNRIIFFEPRQQHRVRRVECWSADFLHGRWAIFGLVHGQRVGSADDPLEGEPLSG